MSEPLRRRRILVTGGTGTLGYNILSQLAGVADYTVIAPIRNMHRVGDELRGKVQFIEHELGDPIHTAQIFERQSRRHRPLRSQRPASPQNLLV